MTVSKEQLILFSAEQDNILPLTSACNVKCVFCSHRQNPAGVQVYGIGHRSLQDVEMTLEFIDPERKIVIGESVTRIMEGEPFLHPEIKTILSMICEHFPDTPIQVTTNGTLLTDGILDLLEELGGIELYISLNSATERGRMLLMGDDGETVRSAIAGLAGRGIRFQGSIVAMPWLVGWEDLEETVAFLDLHRAETVRIFMPGYTAKAPEELRFESDLPGKLRQWVKEMQGKYGTPLTLEPAFLSDLQAEVEGVTLESPAERAGFLRGDEILAIGGEEPFSRVDAFYRLARGGKQSVRVRRQVGVRAEQAGVELSIENGDKHNHEMGIEEDVLLSDDTNMKETDTSIKREKVSKDVKELLLTLDKVQGERSGLVFAYDLHPDIYEQVSRLIHRYKAKRTLLYSSTLAEPLIRALGERIMQTTSEVKITTVAVPNRFFGGSIMAAGLLVVQDFIDQWNELSDTEYDLVLLPGIFLDPWGVDLTGQKVSTLEERIGIRVELVEI